MIEDNGPTGEFGWIARIRERFASLVPPGMEGIGDDCAVIPMGADESLVVTTDLLVEGVHFLPNRITPEYLGYKSLAVNLSDIAAMGAAPLVSFLSIGIPPAWDEARRDGFLNGYHSLSEEFRVPLLGGDTTSSDKLTINVTVLGKAQNNHIKRRKAARPGDLVCVTGPLGDSAAGLRLVLAQKEFSVDEQELVYAHVHPKPYVREGIWLGARPGVHALMDVSDGVASDLVHILEESGVSAEVELTQLPLSDPFARVCVANGWGTEELAVAGGEDYVLLLTVAPEEYASLQEAYTRHFGTPLSVIGKIDHGKPEITWKRNGKPVAAKWKGFTHF